MNSLETSPDTKVEVIVITPLTTDEAIELTSAMKESVNHLYVLIKRAYEGKAWDALGYANFEAYVKEEFDYSRSYAYKLLNQAKVVEAIEAAAPEGTEVVINESTARSLKKSLPGLVEAVRTTTHGMDAEEASGAIEDLIGEYRGDSAERFSSGGETIDFESRLVSADTTDLSSPAPDKGKQTSENEESKEKDPIREKSDKIFEIYTSLRTVAGIESPESLIGLIPEINRGELSELLENVIPKLVILKKSCEDSWGNDTSGVVL